MLDAETLAAIASPSFTPRRTLSIKEAAAWLGFKHETTRKLFHAGHVEGYDSPIGGIRIYADSVEALKERYANRVKQETAPATEPPPPARPRKRPVASGSYRPLRHLR